MSRSTIKEAEDLAQNLLMSGKASHVDIVPSAYRLSRTSRGEVERTTSVLVVAQSDREIEGLREVVVAEETKVEEVIPDWEAKWLSSPEMVRERIESRNHYDDEQVRAGGDEFFFQTGGEEEEEEEEKKKQEVDGENDVQGPEDLDEESHMSLVRW